MTDDDQAQHEGAELLSRLSTGMVRAQKKFFGKGPVQAKSYFLDDMLFIVMRGGMTTAEKTMRDFGEEDRVRDFRQAFENQMTAQLTDMVEGLTGRKVLTYQSQILFDPDRVIEIFIFDDQAPEALTDATAEGQLESSDIGEVDGADVGLDEPSAGGED